MPDYSKGKIYTIRNRNDDTKIYVGSTIQSLAVRFGEHKRKAKQEKYMNILLYKEVNNDWTNWYIELYENYSCSSKEELCKREGEVIRLIGTLNARIEGRDDKQYRIENADKIKEHKQQYYIENADQLKEKHKQYRIENADKIKEYYIKNADKLKEKHKQYHIENADKIKEKAKQYYIENADKKKEYQQQYRIENTDKIKEYKRLWYLKKKENINP